MADETPDRSSTTHPDSARTRVAGSDDEAVRGDGGTIRDDGEVRGDGGTSRDDGEVRGDGGTSRDDGEVRGDGGTISDDETVHNAEGTSDAEAVIRGDEVVKEYQTGDQRVRALKGIDFSIEPGEFVAVVGPSGSGKSTLLNILGLLDGPTEGVVRLRGEDVATFDDRERTAKRKQVIGFVFQSFYLIPTLTAIENVEMPRMLDRTPVETRQRARRLLERVGLGDRLDHYPDELSGGQKQRVAIARSLINDPALLLADEPTGNLDRDTGDRILALFDELRAEENVAVVTVTHDEYVADSADRVVNLIDGVVQDGN